MRGFAAAAGRRLASSLGRTMTNSRAARWIQVVWLGAMVAALVIVVIGYWPVPSTREPSIAFLGFLLVMSFPLGYIGFFVLGLLADVLALTPLRVVFENRFAEVIVVWVGLTAMGWFQWFVLVPWLVRALRRRLLARAQRAA